MPRHWRARAGPPPLCRLRPPRPRRIWARALLLLHVCVCVCVCAGSVCEAGVLRLVLHRVCPWVRTPHLRVPAAPQYLCALRWGVLRSSIVPGVCRCRCRCDAHTPLFVWALMVAVARSRPLSDSMKKIVGAWGSITELLGLSQYFSNLSGNSPARARLCVMTKCRLHSVTEASRTVDSCAGSAKAAMSASSVLSLVGKRCLSHASRWRRYLITAYSPASGVPQWTPEAHSSTTTSKETRNTVDVAKLHGMCSPEH